MSEELCNHFTEQNSDITHMTLETTDGCYECLKINGTWINLRQCMNCGVVLCCDPSPNKHATAHFNETKHPVINLLESNNLWCYADEMINSTN